MLPATRFLFDEYWIVSKVSREILISEVQILQVYMFHFRKLYTFDNFLSHVYGLYYKVKGEIY